MESLIVAIAKGITDAWRDPALKSEGNRRGAGHLVYSFYKTWANAEHEALMIRSTINRNRSTAANLHYGSHERSSLATLKKLQVRGCHEIRGTDASRRRNVLLIDDFSDDVDGVEVGYCRLTTMKRGRRAGRNPHPTEPGFDEVNHWLHRIPIRSNVYPHGGPACSDRREKYADAPSELSRHAPFKDQRRDFVRVFARVGKTYVRRVVSQEELARCGERTVNDNVPRTINVVPRSTR